MGILLTPTSARNNLPTRFKVSGKSAISRSLKKIQGGGGSMKNLVKIRLDETADPFVIETCIADFGETLGLILTLTVTVVTHNASPRP